MNPRDGWETVHMTRPFWPGLLLILAAAAFGGVSAGILLAWPWWAIAALVGVACWGWWAWPGEKA